MMYNGFKAQEMVPGLIWSIKMEKRSYEKLARDITLGLCVSANPKKVGSKSHARFDVYFTLGEHFTIAEALEGGLTMGDIKWDMDHSFIAMV